MPFVKTPANIINRAFEYSPFGIIKNVASTAKELKNGNLDQARFSNESARNILGSAMFGGGVAMASNNALTGKYSDDKDMKNAQKASGMQENALNVGGKNINILWVPVIGNDMVAASAAYNAYKDSKDKNVESAVESGVKGSLKSLFDQSMFQGLQRLMGTTNSYNSDKSIADNVLDTLKSGATQAVPSLARQVAQVSDPYERQLTGVNDNDYYINSLKSAIPGMRQTLPIKTDNEGNSVLQNQGRSVPEKILEDMFLPGKVTDVSTTELNNESMSFTPVSCLSSVS